MKVKAWVKIIKKATSIVEIIKKILTVVVYWSPFIASYLFYELLRNHAIEMSLRGSIDFKTLRDIDGLLMPCNGCYHVMFQRGEWLIDIVSSITYYIHPWDIGLLALYYYVKKKRGSFLRILLTFTLTAYIGLLIYLLRPSAPPWLSCPNVFERKNVAFEKLLLKHGFKVYRDPFPVGSFPSLHVGFATVVAVFLYESKSRYVKLLAYSFLIAVVIDTIYTANHFLIDGITGFFIAMSSYLVSNIIFARYMNT